MALTSSSAALALPLLGDTSGSLSGYESYRSQESPSQSDFSPSCCSEPVDVLAELGGGRASSVLTVPPCSLCSDSDEEENTKGDNTALLRFHLKYEADILFTRWARTPREGRGCMEGVNPKMGHPLGSPDWVGVPGARPQC